MRKMPLVFNNPQHWHARAVEARTLADPMTDTEPRERMLVIASQYASLTPGSPTRTAAGFSPSPAGTSAVRALAWRWL